MKACLSTFNANHDGGVFIITSSIAGIRPNGSSMPYSVTKAAQLHLMRCLASTQGPKIKVNAVSPGLLLTEWGQLYGEAMVKRMEERAWLKKVVRFLMVF
jgi:NAD(P)-dependent dehydrogenase (short-subunit alcohol dehydrogenase family)